MKRVPIEGSNWRAEIPVALSTFWFSGFDKSITKVSVGTCIFLVSHHFIYKQNNVYPNVNSLSYDNRARLHLSVFRGAEKLSTGFRINPQSFITGISVAKLNRTGIYHFWSSSNVPASHLSSHQTTYQGVAVLRIVLQCQDRAKGF